MTEKIHQANDQYGDLKRSYLFVAAEKQGGVFRNNYTTSLPSTKPDVVFGNTLPWGSNMPDGIFVDEQYDPRRGSVDQSSVRERAYIDGREHILRSGKQPIIYGWFDTALIRNLANETHAAAVVTRDETIAASIEDKSLLAAHFQFAEATSAAMPEHAIFDSVHNLPDFRELRDQFRLPFVVQGESMGGNGTKIIDHPSDYIRAVEGLRGAIRVSQFIDAPYSSIYSLSLPLEDGSDVATYVDTPSFKLIGSEELGGNAVSGSGGDWLGARDGFDPQETIANIAKLSSYLYKRYGYFGHFVVEGFISDTGSFLFNEINARPGGGSEVDSINQLQRGMTPFVVQHMLGRLGLWRGSADEANGYNEQTRYETMHGKEKSPFYLRYKNNRTEPMRPSNAWHGSGIYHLSGESLDWAREGAATSDADLANDEVLLAMGPADNPDATVAPGKNVCQIEGITNQPIVENNHLSGQAILISRAVGQLFV